jgi:proline iminopeptidase
MSTQTVEEVQTPGAVLWTVSRGDGLPVVLCHGGPGLSDNLGPLACMIDDLARVHCYDQRGSGRSRGDGGFDVDTFVADLEALRTHWGHPKWVVGGHSGGANLALFYALAHPKPTLGVIYLAGTGLRWGWQQDAQRRRRARLSDAERAELADLQRRLAVGDTAAIERFLRLMWITDFADRRHAHVLDEQPLYRFPRDEHIFRAVTETYKTHLETGVEDQVRLLDVPVLVIHGAHDTDPARARRVAQLAPRGRWVELEHSAHCPWLEEPAALCDALRRFLHDLA